MNSIDNRIFELYYNVFKKSKTQNPIEAPRETLSLVARLSYFLTLLSCLLCLWTSPTKYFSYLVPIFKMSGSFPQAKILCKLKKRKLRKTRCPDNKRLRFLDNKGHQSISHITHVTENGAKFWYVLKAGLYSSLKLESPNRLGF